jgi:diguanylate cyclase (GGDEF)-like protein
MVFNRTDGSVLFENDVAMQTDEIERTILEGVEEYMNMADEERKNHKPREYYDPTSGLWFEIKFSDLTWIDGSPVIVCTAVDTTQRKKNQQKIEYQANNDFLTGLYNRMKCESDLRNIIKAAEDNGEKGAVMFIDLDDFKHINDGLGHQYGDVLLQQIAAGLQGVPGLRGCCYRMGGDEFLVIVKPDKYKDIERTVKNVLSMFNKPWYLMGTEYYCTMSMGIATFPDNSNNVHEIIKMADVAMYESKKSGKNCYNYYDADKKTNTAKQLDIENNMRQAVASQIQEFVVFYQPIVDSVTRECISCEALVRWDSKALGFMGPGDFIPLAEYLGLITDIGDYILEEACRQCKVWNDAGFDKFRVNVNLSVVQLLQKNVTENISNIIKRSGVNPANIELEITESFAINDMDRVMNIVEELKKAGSKIALDDFGTGYSSLNYIKQLPLDIIKIDKTFIDDVVSDDYAQAFVKLIVDLSKTIGTRIIVEGVESPDQYTLIRDLGVDFIQGYLFGKPVPAAEFEEKYLGKVLG